MERADKPNLDSGTADSLLRKWGGSATPVDNDVIEAWLGSEPDNPELHHLLRKAWEAPAQRIHVADTERFRKEVRSAIRAESSGEARGSHRDQGVAKSFAVRGWRYAVIVAACCVVAVMSRQAFQVKFNGSNSEPETYTTYATKPGQRASLTLANGSRVTLGPLTTLRVVKSHSIEQRHRCRYKR